jgi:hypothetical protein
MDQKTSMPPALAVGALYDSFLQAALKQFFARATFESESVLSASSDGRLAIEPSDDPGALIVRWFGTRYVLRVPPRRLFTSHEIRLARAIGSVLAARYHAILNPKAMVARSELFRGAIEDRYVGAFVEGRPYPLGPGEARADQIALAIEVLRVAALSSYENRPISTGVLLLGDPHELPDAQGDHSPASPQYSQALTGIKSFFRVVDGLRTLFVVDRAGVMRDVIDIDQWAGPPTPDALPAPMTYQAHARATVSGGNVVLVLSPSHEIKVFAEGAQVLTFRNASWNLLDLRAKYDLWAEAVGNQALARRLFQTALDLADAREGALFVVLRDAPTALDQLVALADRIDFSLTGTGLAAAPTRRDLLRLVIGQSATELPASVLAALASLDGATVMDPNGRLLAVGAILRHAPGSDSDFIVEGARTTAAIAATHFGPVLKVSEDGAITFYDQEKVWEI